MRKKDGLLYIGDKTYVFNFDKIEAFINYSDKTTSKEMEILDSYDNGVAVSKTVRELTTPGNQQIDSIRYDLIKTFIVQIITFDTEINDVNNLTFGMKLAVNTMLNFGFLEELD